MGFSHVCIAACEYPAVGEPILEVSEIGACMCSAQGLHVPVELAGEVYEAGNQGYRVRRSGLDAVEFLLAAGPAEPLRPLGAVASGGESARVMFALKAAPAIAAASESDDSSPAQERGAGAGLQSEGPH